MDPGVLALLIPVLALATGFVAVLKMPREAFMGKRRELPDNRRLAALEEEVGRLRDELISARERLDFTERLLSAREPVPLPAPERPGAQPPTPLAP